MPYRPFGENIMKKIPVDVDEETLQTIAKMTNANITRADSLTL